MYRVLASSIFLSCCALVLVGCGPDVQDGDVTADVTLDGQPLKEGMIRFVPADGKTAAKDGPIANGKFTGKAPLGDVKVEITAPKVVGKKKMYDTPDSPTVDQIEELLDAKYNVKSELKMTVKPGPQTQKFELVSTKK